MLDDEDSGTRTGIWVALGVVFFVITGVIGGLVLRQLHAHGAGAGAAAAAAPASAPATPAAAASAADTGASASGIAAAVDAAASGAATALGDAASAATGAAAGAVAQAASAVEGAATKALAVIDAPLTGALEGTVYFGSGKAELPAEAKADVAKALKALAAAKGKKLVLSGFHDASGDPVKNGELAKQRAIAVRDALIAGGADAAAVLLRKPESTSGGGDAKTARRVEIRLVD